MSHLRAAAGEIRLWRSLTTWRFWHGAQNSRRRFVASRGGGDISHTMIPVLMLMFSCMALVQFFMSYCRSLLLTYAKVELSPATREMIGVEPSQIRGEQFGRLMGLARLAPNPGDDKWEIRVVSIYYAAVRLTNFLASPLGPVVRKWAQQQANLCAYFAAATLDRRIAAVTAG